MHVRTTTDRITEPKIQPRRSQETFEGSNPDIRGRLVRAACDGPIPMKALASFDSSESKIGHVHEIASRLVAGGSLVRGARGELRLA